MSSLRRVPPWLVLAAIVVASSIFRIVLGREVVGPWIMVDELIYSELAKSFAASGHFEIRGVASNGYGFVYPALIAPAWRLFGATTTVYDVAKAINAVVMSLAAVPAYFLARRLLSTRAALVAAALTVLIPSMLYTSELMTENAFYPLFLCVILALVVTLERPTPRRQVLVLLLCGLAYATRQQAVALVPAVAIAPALLGWIDRDLKRQLRDWLVTYAILGIGAVVVLGGTLARGRSPLTLLGAYRAATSVPYSLSSVLHYLLWHVAELDLYLGFIPFAALLAIWFAPRATSPAARAFAAATLPVTVLLAVEVALFASTQSGRIEERNLFYVAPFGLIALAGVAARDVVPRARWAIAAAALIAAVLPVTIPLARFVNTTAVSDTFGLLPWWWIQDHGIHFGPLRFVVLGTGIVACAVFVLLPRRHARWLAVLVAAYFGVATAVVQNGPHGIVKASRGNLFAGIHAPHRNWIDRAVGRNANVTAVWSAGLIETIWNNEFFNRSVRTVVDTGNVFTGGLPEQSLRVLSDGEVVDASGKPFSADDVLAPESAFIAGKTIASDPGTGMLVAHVGGPLFVLSKVTGLYANDTWSGKRVTFLRRRCVGGYVSVVVQSDQSLFTSNQVITARSGGRVVATTTLAPDSEPKRFLVPLTQSGNGSCTAVFTMKTVLIPARVEPSSADKRPLGAHFLAFSYLP